MFRAALTSHPSPESTKPSLTLALKNRAGKEVVVTLHGGRQPETLGGWATYKTGGTCKRQNGKWIVAIRIAPKNF